MSRKRKALGGKLLEGVSFPHFQSLRLYPLRAFGPILRTKHEIASCSDGQSFTLGPTVRELVLRV